MSKISDTGIHTSCVWVCMGMSIFAYYIVFIKAVNQYCRLCH